MKADYPLYFINSVFNEFQKGKECGDESFMTPPSWFEITKSFIFIEIPYCGLNEVKSKHFLMKFHEFTSNSFRLVRTWKTRNKKSLFPLKIETIKNRLLPIKGIIIVVYRTLLKPNVMQKLDGINLIIRLKVQNHQNIFEATSTTVLHELSFQMLQKMLKPRRT